MQSVSRAAGSSNAPDGDQRREHVAGNLADVDTPGAERIPVLGRRAVERESPGVGVGSGTDSANVVSMWRPGQSAPGRLAGQPTLPVESPQPPPAAPRAAGRARMPARSGADRPARASSPRQTPWISGCTPVARETAGGGSDAPRRAGEPSRDPGGLSGRTGRGMSPARSSRREAEPIRSPRRRQRAVWSWRGSNLVSAGDGRDRRDARAGDRGRRLFCASAGGGRLARGIAGRKARPRGGRRGRSCAGATPPTHLDFPWRFMCRRLTADGGSAGKLLRRGNRSRRAMTPAACGRSRLGCRRESQGSRFLLATGFAPMRRERHFEGDFAEALLVDSGIGPMAARLRGRVRVPSDRQNRSPCRSAHRRSSCRC